MILLESRSYNLETQKGFIALMSAIIISVVLLLMITNLSLTGFYGRFNVLDSELKERSSALAEACVDTALLRIANDPTYPYPTNDPINVDGNDCIIESATGGNISTTANYKNYITNLKIEVDSDLNVTRWEETPN